MSGAAAGDEKARITNCWKPQMKIMLKASQPDLKPGHVLISSHR